MFGLGALASFAIYAGIALAALLAIHGFDKSRQNIGRDAQRAEDAPVMSLCDSMAPASTGFFGAKKVTPAECAVTLRAGLDALTANVTLQQDVARLDVERKTCSSEVARLERQGKRAADLAAARKPGDEKAIAAIAADKQALIAALAEADSKAGTCEERLARRDALWSGIAVQRQRDFPPPTAAAPPGDVSIRSPK